MRPLARKLVVVLSIAMLIAVGACQSTPSVAPPAPRPSQPAANARVVLVYESGAGVPVAETLAAITKRLASLSDLAHVTVAVQGDRQLVVTVPARVDLAEVKAIVAARGVFEVAAVVEEHPWHAAAADQAERAGIAERVTATWTAGAGDHPDAYMAAADEAALQAFIASLTPPVGLRLLIEPGLVRFEGDPPRFRTVLASTAGDEWLQLGVASTALERASYMDRMVAALVSQRPAV